GILKARPGIGKTVMSTYLTCKLGFKTLIVVDNSNLLKQWVNAFYNFTDIEPEDISVFKQKIFQTDTPITIAMIQTLTRRLKNDMKKTYELVNSNKFGFIIYDEVHNTSSATEFAKGSLLFRTKNVLGLSATPFQTGISELLMIYTIGDVIYETNDYDLIPEFKFILYDSQLENKYKLVIGKSQDYKIKKAIYNKGIIDSEIYRNLILEYTKKLLKDNHKIMIICFTKKQVQVLSELLTSQGIQNTMFYGEQKVINYNEQILVATYSFAGKGFDYADLSAMILACPLAGKKSVIQTVGRILRSGENKIQPVVIDLIDLAVAHTSLRELKIKKSIVSEEFKCKISEESYEQ
ncbi:MAG: DEAD/DEAH box helicase, partial [bacterium]